MFARSCKHPITNWLWLCSTVGVHHCCTTMSGRRAMRPVVWWNNFFVLFRVVDYQPALWTSRLHTGRCVFSSKFRRFKRYSSLRETHFRATRATERHLPYGITQCYPTQVNAICPAPARQADSRDSSRDGRLSRYWCWSGLYLDGLRVRRQSPI